ncbi:UDP-N-acetylhexosamine pyrophosphorylase [Microplitis mediator]|uniref:UDP-N-acetylhexosamine pyrophosphorylase n=1 Tax=Microplitis mediator TaxID=375433 RepID=UPI002555B45E|nr:UDP-N-acetylhexosamine pyrophosphorylase [Microplitis mediator]XP_057337642.1 UDP-N-acetylhexosamine pyrophosphorylase [Microplitis mediator]
MDEDTLRAQLNKYNQGHVLQFWKELTEDQRASLTEDILEFSLSEVTSYFKRATESSENNNKLLDDRIQPIEDDAIKSVTGCDSALLKKYQDTGLREIAAGRVAVLVLAGGQGTRLGVTCPKGMYDVGLPSHKSLFQLQAEKIRRLEVMAKEKYGKCQGITWYLMTSEATHESTLDFLEQNNYFGLNKNNVKAFKQGMIPCFGFDGKILLDEMHSLSKAPDGNGGLYRALKVQGILQDMTERGINSIHAHSVDNILIKVADPVFIGYCIDKGADCGVKVVDKADPSEAVGVVCQVDGKYQVVEYSEISKKTSELRRPDGKLVFNAGNICNHYFTLGFFRNISDYHEEELPLHVAKKKIPYVDNSGVRQKPTSPNGIKIEKFIFDVLKFSKNFVAWEVPRESEFSPLKNSDSAGQDCPSTARDDLLALHKKWLLNAGAKSVQGEVEISPLLSYAGENLKDIPEIIQGPKVFE